MADLARHLDVILRPDASRTVIRPFEVGDPEGYAVEGHPRGERIVARVLALDDAALKRELSVVEQSLDTRHAHVELMLLQRIDELDWLKARDTLSKAQKLLIGAYFSEEFSFESAALFNPSIVRHPDQGGLKAGDTRFILTLRGIGEGHVSSLTFRTGTWAADGGVVVDKPSPRAIGPKIETGELPNGERIVHLHCDVAQDVSESVIFPFLPSQGRGIEDVRLVQFAEDDGKSDFRGTFTAFSGEVVREVILRTPDFKTFELRGVEGPYARAKGMAMFPRRIDGRYYMLSRQDNESVWLMSSDDPFVWEGGEKLLSPKFPWEFVQMGNCGSPLEIDEGWLVLTHGVGVVRNYCVGAALLDKKDPSKVLGRLETPLLEPGDSDRDGYVPNVVYSCGALLRDRTLLVPYGVADNYTGFATVDVDALVAAMR